MSFVKLPFSVVPLLIAILALTVVGFFSFTADVGAISYVEPELESPYIQPLNSGPTAQRKLGNLMIGYSELWEKYICLNADLNLNPSNPLDDISDAGACISNWQQVTNNLGDFVKLFTNPITGSLGDINRYGEVPNGLGGYLPEYGYAWVTARPPQRFTTLLAVNGQAGIPSVALYAWDSGNISNNAAAFAGPVVIDNGQICLNGTGGNCIDDWSDIDSGGVVNYWKINSDAIYTPTNAQPGGVALTRTGNFGSAIAGNPPGSFLSATCGDNLQVSGEDAGTCAIDSAVVNGLTSLTSIPGNTDARINFTTTAQAPTNEKVCVTIVRRQDLEPNFSIQTGVRYLLDRTVRTAKVVYSKCLDQPGGGPVSDYAVDDGLLNSACPLNCHTAYYEAFQGNAYPKYGSVTKVTAIPLSSKQMVTARLTVTSTGCASTDRITSNDGRINCSGLGQGICSALYYRNVASPIQVTLQGPGDSSSTGCQDLGLGDTLCVMNVGRTAAITCGSGGGGGPIEP